MGKHIHHICLFPITRYAIVLTVVAMASASLAQTSQRTGDSGAIRPRDSIHQQDPEYVRASLGLGTSTLGIPEGKAGWGYYASWAYQQADRVYTLRASMNHSEIFLFDEPARSVWEFAAMYGFTRTKYWTHISYSAGVSVEGTERRVSVMLPGSTVESFDHTTTLGAGIVAEFQAIITPVSFFGIGGAVFGSLNTTHSYLSGMLILQAGILR